MAKTKITMFLDQDLIEWLDQNRDEETSRSAYLRILIRKDMKSKARRKTNKLTSTASDPFTFFTISPDLIPEDLKEYADLIIEWWPIRKKKGGSCTTSVANRIFKKLRSFPTQDRKQALENAIAGGWMNLFPVKHQGKQEEQQSNHPARRVFTAERGFE